ncbi:MAG: aminotransferase class I/II-fold pyridoxal phosphate-dependent enzyme, partial [Pseudolabrys sp.]
LYADISRFSDDSLDFAKRMLNEAGVAATPGIDFDPVDGRHFLRFCYAGSTAEMHEAVKRIGGWIDKKSRGALATVRAGTNPAMTSHC